MDLKCLNYLVTVLELGSLARASARPRPSLIAPGTSSTWAVTQPSPASS